MEKEEIRKELFKLRNNGNSYNQCRKILKARFDYECTIRTLKRWNKRLDSGAWDLMDKSTRPKTIHTKITPELEKKILLIRNKTGWGEHKIVSYHSELGLSHASVYSVLNKHRLTKKNENRRKRIKYIRWQR
jgi:hypothetical protein